MDNTSTPGALSPQTAALLEGLLPEQRQIVTTLDRPVFVAAGAGSGKTFTLTRRIVWALCPGSGEGGKPFLDSLDQALIITFTEKAAGEIKERIRGALRQAGLADEALRVDSAWVSTIHHMCARILRAHALDLGLDPSFSMVSEQGANVMRAQATEDALALLEGDPGLDALFEEYKAEGAGVEALVGAMRDKAAAAERGLESLEFVPARIDLDGAMRCLLDAYEALCACDSKYDDELEKCRAARDLLRGFYDLAPQSRTARAASDLLGRVYRPNGNKWRAAAVKQFCKEAQALLAAAMGEASLARAQELEEPLMRLTTLIDELYAAAKRARGVLDNDDLLQLLAKAFREHPDIAARYASKFKLVMVDEFQDTNGQQVSMVKGLSGEGACHLTTVGDAQQAIYGFRGADVGVFEERGAEVGEAQTVRLDYNFRSDDAILRFVACVCGKTGIVPAFMDLKANPRRTSAFPTRLHPRVAIELTRAHKLGQKAVPAPLRKRMAAAQLADRLARVRDAGIPARKMAVLMRSLNDAGFYIEALRERGLESVVVGGSTFSQAPEVRTVCALMRALASPQDTKSGLFPVLESDMFALDANDMLLLATKPQEAIDAPAKRRIYPGARAGEPIFGAARGSRRLEAARRVLTRAWERVGTMDAADVALMAIRESGWLARLEREGVEGRSRAANILAAVRHVRELAGPDGLDAICVADEFERWLDAAKEGPASLSGEGLDAVSLMTAHASKGLEFDVVAVVGCCGKERAHKTPRLLSRRAGDRAMLSLAPATLSKPDLGEDAPTCVEECTSPLEWRCLMEAEYAEAQQREDGRLLYVALTRAKECVILALDAVENKGGALAPAMTGQIVDTVVGQAPLAGESAFAYGGVEPGVLRCVDLSLCEDGSVAVESNNTLAVCEATRLCADAGRSLDAGDGEDGREGSAPSTQAGETSFGLMAEDFDAATRAPVAFWRPREDVFSYSSAHARLGEPGAPAPDEVLELPRPEEVVWGVLAQPQDGRPAPAPAMARPLPVGEGEDEAFVQTADADRATALGSAFHELARYMVETGHVPDARRRDVVASAMGMARRDRARLDEALARWEHSALRAEVLTHRYVRAEVPFFCEVTSALGSNLEGAMDLLASDAVPQAGHALGAASDEVPSALLVDYKTGDRDLGAAQIAQAHELQARVYAQVLRFCGYGAIECAFVCVELEDVGGEPFVVRYRF